MGIVWDLIVKANFVTNKLNLNRLTSKMVTKLTAAIKHPFKKKEYKKKQELHALVEETIQKVMKDKDKKKKKSNEDDNYNFESLNIDESDDSSGSESE